MVLQRVMAEVEHGLSASMAALDADAAASPVLRAVVEEFARKLANKRGPHMGSDERLSREALIELEQAADSARYAALADPGAATDTRDLIVETPDWVCTYKVTGQPLRPET